MSSDLATNEVTALYESVLFRQPDSDGLAGWANELDSGQITLTGLITAFVDSPEAQNLVDPIIELYDGLYSRAPDIPGLQYWVSQAAAGMSMSTIAQYFVTSQEFYADYGMNIDVGSKLRAVRGRTLGPGSKGYTLKLGAGARSLPRRKAASVVRREAR